MIILLCCPSNAISWNHLSGATKRSFERDRQKAGMSGTLQLQSVLNFVPFVLSSVIVVVRLDSAVQLKVVVNPTEEVNAHVC